MLDPTTLAAYRAAQTAQARAQAVRDSLGSGTLTVELREGASLVYTGSFSGPMTAGADGSLSASAQLAGLVTTAGTPNAATWTCRIANGSGRYIEGSFGPGGRFTWSQGTLRVGDVVRLDVSIAAAGAAMPAWRTALSPGQWYALPNTQLSSVDPSPRPYGVIGPAAKVIAWCGATLKRQGSVYLIGAAGGHNDYAGNEVDALALNAETPQWVELRGPSAYEVMYDAVEVYGDGRRAATHTYYATQFVESRNCLVITPAPGMGASAGALPPTPEGYPYPDNGSTVMCAFSLDTNDWLDPSTLPPYPGAGGDWTACLAATHPETGDIYYARGGTSKLWRWLNATNEWQQVGTYWHSNYAGAAIDPTRSRMLVVGDRAPLMVDIATGETLSVSFSGLGADALNIGNYPAVAYDGRRDEFLVVKNGDPISVYRVTAGDLTVGLVSVTGDIPPRRINGIHNAAQYVPELDGLVLCHAHAENVKFLALS